MESVSHQYKILKEKRILCNNGIDPYKAISDGQNEAVFNEQDKLDKLNALYERKQKHHQAKMESMQARIDQLNKDKLAINKQLKLKNEVLSSSTELMDKLAPKFIKANLGLKTRIQHARSRFDLKDKGSNIHIKSKISSSSNFLSCFIFDKANYIVKNY